MATSRSIAALLAAPTALLLGASGALAAPASAGALAAGSLAAAAAPANDTYQGATNLYALPKTLTQSTAKATTDAVDAKYNEMCGAPFTNGSVWFKYTDTSGKGISADMSESDFTGGFLIVRGDPGTDGELVGCGPTLSAAKGEPGAKYYIAAFSDTAQVGGSLKASFDFAPPAPTMKLTVRDTGVALRNGDAVVGGRYKCTNSAYDHAVLGSLVQRWKRVKISGEIYTPELTCDGVWRNWKARVSSSNGYYAPGKAAFLAIGLACGTLECTETPVVEKTIMLVKP